ncbi:Mg2+/Co2+ transporter CorB [Rhodothalassium salexigens DSM 2132]|uniref:Mg2+/Co2+ transporter CorB n=1 Tax=Rhodothalassium salexigens DSM 2132 TaxID=1188247 RepID=A0A4R2PH10_RHOSA|nr:HlyC/CorC family transporter [Rhodothalassium salexigens]MBB4211975.1 Mg2+/Co2+ transporter CorB [Rhodothalassium salexigens DSM 2132]TCP33441.1 Mg2+/Co2+ transporter CorB [Rhodothalassium salexigens DSM 2132]
MMVETALTIGVILLLLALSGLFSGSETALTAASPHRLHRFARDGDPRAVKVARLITDKERLIGGILLGNNLVNILASALATSLFIGFVGEEGVVYATLLMTALVLIFAEVLPKTYAIANADRMALVVGPVIGVVVRLFAPVVRAVQVVVRLTLRLFGVDVSATSALSGQEEIRGAIEFHASEGGLRKAHRDMLGSILDLDELQVNDVMIHRQSMHMLDLAQPAADLVAQVMRAPYTRIPLYEDEPENIVGVLHAKDLLRAVLQAGGGIDAVDVRALMKEPWFVPDTTTLREQLNTFRARRAHFALVVDEYGTLMGLVTLEDILEEIVGDISDEHDVAVAGVQRQADGSVITEGLVSVRDLNREFDWSLPDDEASTIAGMVIYEAETLPVVGDAFDFHGFRFEVLGRRHNRLTKLRIVPPAPAATPEAD